MDGYDEADEAKRWAATYSKRMGSKVVVIADGRTNQRVYVSNIRAWLVERPITYTVLIIMATLGVAGYATIGIWAQ